MTFRGLFFIAATLCSCLPSRAEACAAGELAHLYARELADAWRDPLSGAFQTVERQRLAALKYPLTPEEARELRRGYDRLIDRFYGSDALLPGVIKYVDKHLSPADQCSVLAYFETEIGGKLLRMQVAAGELEFIRQQATNKRRETSDFAEVRELMILRVLPKIGEKLIESGPIP